MRMHLCCTKSYLLKGIMAGRMDMLKDFDGTQEEAIEAIKNDSRKYFVIGECDNQNEDGECLGHEDAPKCILCDKPAVNDGEYLTELCVEHKAQVIEDDMVIAASEWMDGTKDGV